MLKLTLEAKLMSIDPRLIDPFAPNDPNSKLNQCINKAYEIMKEMCDMGSSVFFSTHVLEVAEKLCNRVAIIRDGQIIAYGTMDEVKGDKSLEEVFLELVKYE